MVCTGSTLLGGDAADTINLGGSGVTSTIISAGAGNDTFTFNGYVTGASILGGTGDDSISFTFSSTNTKAKTNIDDASSNTYFFGTSGGKDTLSFANVSTNGGGTVEMTIAVDSSYGETSDFTFNTATSLISIGTGASIFVTGITGNGAAGGLATQLGFTMTTVSTSVITDLG